MNPEIIRKEIAEVSNKIEIYSAMIDRLNLKKEKLIMFLYEEENLNFDHLGSLETIVDSPNKQLDYASLYHAVPENSPHSEVAQALPCASSPVSSRTAHGAGVAPAPVSSPSYHQTLKASNDYIISVADSIVSLLAKKQLWSFEISYLSQTLKLDKNIINQCLHLKDYSQFWQPHKNQQTNSSFSETWIADLSLINEKHPQHCPVPSTNRPKKKERKVFKRSLPPNSTNDLVEKATSVRDLLDRVFEANRGEKLRSKDILDYLYPDQIKNWTKKEQSFRNQIISRELCTSIKIGNWRRVGTGLYTSD